MMIAVAVDRGLFSPRYRDRDRGRGRDRGHLAVDISTAMNALVIRLIRSAKSVSSAPDFV